MPTDKSFKVNIYRVEIEEIENVIQVSFDQVVQNAWGQPFVDRFKEIGGVWDSLTQWLDNPRDKGITGLRVKGREHDDEPFEIIDLLQQYQKGEILLEVNDDTRNIPLASRWDDLMQVRSRFNQ